MKRFLSILAALGLSFGACAQFPKTIKKDGQKILSGKSPGNSGLTNAEVVEGLKEALAVGAKNSVSFAGRLDGFYKNPRLFIAWPPEAIEMKGHLLRIGFEGKVNEFELSLNRAAEEAVKQAVPIFTAAIANMSVQDGFAILKGNDTAATNYLRKTTYQPLYDKFLPIVQASMKKVEVTKYWTPLVSAYNLVPKVQRYNPNLEEYVTNKAIQGLMLLIADEETKIRKDPAARISAILKKVFGS